MTRRGSGEERREKGSQGVICDSLPLKVWEGEKGCPLSLLCAVWCGIDATSW